MSGTSVDAIDCALVRCHGDQVVVIATHEHAIPPQVKSQIAAISHSGPDEIERMGVLDRALGLLFAKATMQLLDSANKQPEDIKAIGSHGQTIRHRPPSAAASGETSFSLQIGDPNTIAEKNRHNHHCRLSTQRYCRRRGRRTTRASLPCGSLRKTRCRSRCRQYRWHCERFYY